jgi:hypothetical protein
LGELPRRRVDDRGIVDRDDRSRPLSDAASRWWFCGSARTLNSVWYGMIRTGLVDFAAR